MNACEEESVALPREPVERFARSLHDSVVPSIRAGLGTSRLCAGLRIGAQAMPQTLPADENAPPSKMAEADARAYPWLPYVGGGVRPEGARVAYVRYPGHRRCMTGLH